MMSFGAFHTRRYYRIAASFLFFTQGLIFASWASRIPDIKHLLGLSTGALGTVLSAMPAGQFVAMALSGYLVSRYGSKKVLGWAAILYPTTLVLLGTVSAVWQLVGGLLVFGMTSNLINIAINTQGIGIERLYGRSIMASFHGIWSLGGFFGGLLSTLVVGFELIPFYHFLVVYFIALMVLFALKGMLMPRDLVRREGSGPIRVFAKPDRYIALLGFMVFANLICESTMFNWSSIYFEDVIKPNPNLVRMGYIGFMCTMAIGRLTADKIVNRFGVQNTIRASSITIAIGMLLSALFPSLVMATIGFLLVGFGSASIVPICYSMAGKSTKMLPGIALATVGTIGFMGYTMGPPMVGLVADWLDLRWAFALVALTSLAPIFIVRRLLAKPIG
jgi:MFS family permease